MMKFNKLTAALLLASVLVSTSVLAGGGKVEPREASIMVVVEEAVDTVLGWFSVL